MTQFTYTDLYTDQYTGIYGQISGSTAYFPNVPLVMSVQLLLNGTWTDVTGYCYQRDNAVDVMISEGRPDESSILVTAQCALQLNNRNGTFSPKNALSPFYPFITRNTQLRITTQLDYNGADAGTTFLFSGEVSAWPPSWEPTGTDVWTPITASGIFRRLNQQAVIGTALYRYFTLKTDASAPIAYWPCTDAVGATQFAEVTGNGSAATWTGTPTLASDSSFAGSDPTPVVAGSVWTGLTNQYATSGDLRYTTPGTYTWVAPPGISTIDVKAVGGGGGGGGTNGANATAGGGGGGEYAEEPSLSVTPGASYSLTVGGGGVGGTPAVGGTNGGTTTFTGDSVTVTAHGGGHGSGSGAGAGGTGSSNTTHHSGGAGFYSGSLGGGGGASAGSTAAGNSATNATGAAPVDSYAGPGGDGAGAITQNYVRTYAATASYSYSGSDGTFPNTLRFTNGTMEQGGDQGDTFNGKEKTWIVFNSSQIASDLSGATVTQVTLTLYSWHWWFNSGGTVALGWDTRTSFPGSLGDPSGGNIDIFEYGMSVGQILTQSIGTTFGNAFKSSGATSLVLFKNSNSLTYYGKFNGVSQANAPYMTIYYSK